MSNNFIITNTQEIVALVLDGVKSYSRIQALLDNHDVEALFYDTLDVFCRQKAPLLLQKATFAPTGYSRQAFLCRCFENIFLSRCRKFQTQKAKDSLVPLDGLEIPQRTSGLEEQQDLQEWVRECLAELPPTAKKLALALLSGEEANCTAAARKIRLSRRRTELAKKQIIASIMRHPCSSGMLRRLEKNAKKRCEKEKLRAIANEGHKQ